MKIVIASQDHNPAQTYKYEVRSFSVHSPLVLTADNLEGQEGSHGIERAHKE